MITRGQMQWILFWIALFGGEPGLWMVWSGSVILL